MDGSPSESAVDVSDAQASFDDVPSLMTLPRELLISCVLAECDLSTLGRLGTCCDSLCRASQDSTCWQILCERQGLQRHAQQQSISARTALRAAAECLHAETKEASQFHWSASSVDIDRSLRCRCIDCGLEYTVTTTKGFVDTKAFASKLVTQAMFVSTYDAPRHLQSFTAVWGRKAAMPLETARLQARQARTGHQTAAAVAGGDGSSSATDSLRPNSASVPPPSSSSSFSHPGTSAISRAGGWEGAVFLGQEPREQGNQQALTQRELAAPHPAAG